jgi:hypothetical protein
LLFNGGRQIGFFKKQEAIIDLHQTSIEDCRYAKVLFDKQRATLKGSP